MLFFKSIVPAALALSPETVRLMWQTPLLGIGMVFSVLALLWGVLAIFKLIFAGKTPKAPKAPKEVKAPKAEKKTETVAAPVVAQSAGDDAQLIAVITAAVAAYMAEEGTDYAGGFRVVSFKRVRGGRTWNSK